MEMTRASWMASIRNTTASRDWTLGSLNVYLDPASSATRVLVGVYSNNGSDPGTLLARGTIDVPRAGAWNTVSLPPIALTSGGVYWVALLAPAGAGVVRFEDGGGSAPSETSLQTTLSDLPATWLRGRLFPTDGPASIYR